MLPMHFVALCYHYIREERGRDPFPRILGNTKEEFRQHVGAMCEVYEPVRMEEVEDAYSTHRTPPRGARRILFTFDDGVSDHYEASRILDESGTKGAFFVPTCVFEGEPVNPQIIHYLLACYGIEAFLDTYKETLHAMGVEEAGVYHLSYVRGVDTPWPFINLVKKTFKYRISHAIGRAILLSMYKARLLSDYPDMMRRMHLTREQVQDMLQRGHYIGVHSHTHPSLRGQALSPAELQDEVVQPLSILRKEFGITPKTFSFPFGRTQDCLSPGEFTDVTQAYALALTGDEAENTPESAPLALGRYMPGSTETAEDILRVLNSLAE